MQYFWVNLGTTHKEARNGGFLWAPLSPTSASGKATRTHWENVGKVKAGDLIFCYHDNYLRALATAVGDAYKADRPATRSFSEWKNIGYRVDIKITELKRPIHSSDIATEYLTRFDTHTTPSLFNAKNGVNQIYMASIPSDAAVYLLEQGEVISDYEDMLIGAGGSEKQPSTTMREALIKARVGQGAFRAALCKRWNNRCALTGLTNPNLLIASHIHPWARCDNKARLDPDNGLLLAAHIDRLFEYGLISFDESGKLLTSAKLCIKEQEILGLGRFKSIDGLNEGNLEYLSKHRERHRIG
ncbi:HNH endonuclease [Pseudomonas sichuanensis]|uniref:HNH endonuclease signature motif containing protein n=1 Tax=Pseudomonas sichuanensis TaxID=2213015 RepID=A0ABV0DEM0_9PSED